MRDGHPEREKGVEQLQAQDVNRRWRTYQARCGRGKGECGGQARPGTAATRHTLRADGAQVPERDSHD